MLVSSLNPLGLPICPAWLTLLQVSSFPSNSPSLCLLHPIMPCHFQCYCQLTSADLWVHAVPLNALWSTALSNLSILALVNCGLSGSLPEEWGAAKWQLRNLTLSGNFSGSLPDAWLEEGAWPELRMLKINGGDSGTQGSRLQGTLPGVNFHAFCAV